MNIRSLITKGGVGIRNDSIGMEFRFIHIFIPSNSDSFPFSFQVSKHAISVIVSGFEAKFDHLSYGIEELFPWALAGDRGLPQKTEMYRGVFYNTPKY